MFLKSWIQSLTNRMSFNRPGCCYGLTSRTRHTTRRSRDVSVFVAGPSLETLETRQLLAAAAPTGLDLAETDDTNITTDNITTVTTGLTISGSGETGAMVTLFDDANSNDLEDGGETLNTGLVSLGTFNIDVALAEGVHNVKAIQADSVASAALTITIDVTADAAPGALDLNAASDLGVSITDNITSDNTPTIIGTGVNGSTVTLTSDVNGTVGTAVVASGVWSITASTLTAGAQSLTATQMDVAGNVSVASAALGITIDVTADAAPGALDLAAASDLGVSITDNITSDNTPTITGTGVNGSTVTLTSDVNGTVGTAVVASGVWSITASTLTAGAQSLTAIQMDVAGNVSVASAALGITVDTLNPTVVVNIVDASLNDIDGISIVTFMFSESTTDFTSGDITAVGGTVTSLIGSGTSYSATFTVTDGVDLTGSVSVTSGSYTDAAGNIGLAGTDTVVIGTQHVVVGALPTSGGPFRVLVDEDGLLHVRRSNGTGTDLITPVSVTGTVSITINGSTSADSVVLDASLASFAGAFVFNGGNGNDKLDATQVDFAVTFDGGAGNDTLLGSSGSDVFHGGAGNDSAIGGDGNDSLNGDAGNDRLDGSGDADEIAGGLGNDTANGGDGDDELYGDAGNDNLNGGNGEDTVTGGLGNDKLIGGADADDSSDLLEEYVSGISVLSATKLTGAGTDSHSGFERFLITGSEDSDSISASTMLMGVTLVGGAGNDTLTGSLDSDVIQGGDGNDVMLGGAGNDTLEGQAQDDILNGGFGDDSLNGGEGRDRVTESANADFTLTDTSLIGVGTDELIDVETAWLNGGASANTIDASVFTLGGVTMNGGHGNDVLLGGGSADFLNGGTGNDTLEGNAGNDSLIGQAGNDELNGGTDNDTLTGGVGDDILAGSDGTDRLVETGNVNMMLTASAFTGLGTDVISDLEEAILTGGNSSNILNALAFGGTSVKLFGLGGNDVLQAGSGADCLDGGTGNDTLQGNGGNDTLTGGTGNDSLDGGANTDLLAESANANFTLINSSLVGIGTDTLAGIENVKLTGGMSNNRLNAGNFSLGSVSLNGGAGNDTLIGGTFGDSLNGGAGNDFLTGRGGDDLLLGGGGNDTASGGADNDTLSGGTGDDLLIGGFGDDAINGDLGDDTALGGQGGPARGGNSSLDSGDVVTVEQIDEAFATIFVIE